MKRTLLSVSAVLLMALLMLSGCTSKLSDMDVEEISSVLEENIHFSSLLDIDSETLQSHFNFPKGAVVDFVFKTAADSDSSADEYGAFLYADAALGAEMNAAVSERIQRRSNVFSETNQQEYEKLKNAVIKQQGNVIVFVICEQWDEAGELLKKHVDEPAKK